MSSITTTVKNIFNDAFAKEELSYRVPQNANQAMLPQKFIVDDILEMTLQRTHIDGLGTRTVAPLRAGHRDVTRLQSEYMIPPQDDDSDYEAQPAATPHRCYSFGALLGAAVMAAVVTAGAFLVSTMPVLGGLAIGIGSVLLFGMLLTPPSTQPAP